ncbi:hypothetical protein BLA27_14265 [Brucella cytisi]|uniref:Uncharacterized protein n=1 Tax=Brucella cytisi TaxID=407152 RepID=A0A1J6ICR2_9HYPH|nr:hypothetical protein BLA27_14265 [Brucella cytisi]
MLEQLHPSGERNEDEKPVWSLQVVGRPLLAGNQLRGWMLEPGVGNAVPRIAVECADLVFRRYSLQGLGRVLLSKHG